MRVSSNFVSVARRLTLAGTAAVVGISIYARDPANDLQASTDESAATELTPGTFSEKTRMRLRDVRAEHCARLMPLRFQVFKYLAGGLGKPITCGVDQIDRSSQA